MSDVSAVEAVLFAALEKPTSAERNAYLDSACAGNAELRRQVERLLKAHANAGDFLRKPAVEQLAAPPEQPDESNVTTDHGRGADSSDGSHPAGDAAGAGLPAVPGYRVLREIARGGMGRVLAAHDLDLDRDVALKILLPAANAERFVRESKITARLPHPGIPPVHALGTLPDGAPFLAMKLVAGQTLAEQMKTADRPRLLQAFVQVCQAVGFAHSKGIIHRDLKPANVMVGAFGEVQVMDWGLAKDLAAHDVAVAPGSPREWTMPGGGADANQTTDHQWPGESTDDRTQAGQVMGTPAYMAPEQARGEPADARADVFALGGILCAILTGQPPFTGKSTLEVIRRARAADLGEAHARLDGCGADAELVALCRACLSANAADRPADGRAVADALTAYLNGVQERLQTAQRERAVALAREAEQRKRRKVYLALAATVLVAVLGGTAGAGIYLMQAQQVAKDKEVAAATEQGRLGRNGDEVRRLLGETAKALEAGHAAKAEQLLAAAGERMNEGGADESSPQFEQLQKDLAVLIDLDRFDVFRWTPVDNKAHEMPAEASWFRAALSRIGLTPESVPAAAAARVSGSPLRDRLVTALDRWLRAEPPSGPGRKWLRAVLRAVDPDPYRDAVRDAVLRADGKTMAKLASRKEAADQPPGFLLFLGEEFVLPAERRRELLKVAVRNRPSELGPLMVLGLINTIEMKVVPGTPDERLRWFQAAVGVAPENSAAWVNLGSVLHEKGQPEEAIACCRRALAIDPKLAVAHYNLGNMLEKEGQPDKAIDCWRKAIKYDPTLVNAKNNLGLVLSRVGRVSEAIACLREVIKLEPKFANAHYNLGVILGSHKRDYDGAIGCFRQVLELDPKFAAAHEGQGAALRAKGQMDAAIAEYRQAIKLAPKLATTHYNLGTIYCDHKHDYDAAIACFREAIKLEPKFAIAHFTLGIAQYARGQLDEAIASCRQAVALDPKLADGHALLGEVLLERGRYAEAGEATARALKLFSNRSPHHARLSQQLQTCERLVKIEGRFPRLLKGEEKAASAQESLDVAQMCYHKRMYAAVARFFADAAAASPRLGNDLQGGHRYRAACAAAQAAAGKGEGAGKLDDKERARLRKQALGWLRADLALWDKQIRSWWPGGAAQARAALAHWQKDPDLAGIRDGDALAKLPAEERTACTQLWADVAALLKKAQAPAPKDTSPDRRAAEYVLSIGGTVVVNEQRLAIKAADLPSKSFRLTGVVLSANKQVTVAGLAVFKDYKSLTTLDVNATQVSDAGLAHLEGCKNLTTLSLDNTPVSDTGLARLKDFKNLKVLDLYGCKKVSDAGLSHLQDCKNLKVLWLKATNVTAAGIDALKKALPKCKIEWNGGVITPR
jgi:tetratricopeptide (TPR) repeat protein